MEERINKPELSIIIPAVGNVDLTRACIESIREHSVLFYEIILVDNGSDSQECQELSKLGTEVCLHYKELLGYPAAINRGVVASSGTYICLLNNDTEIRTPKWDKILISALESYPGAEIISPTVDMIGNPFQRVEGPNVGIFESPYDLYFVFVLMRRSLFDRVGFLDERFGLGNWEDIEFCGRVKSQGGKFIVDHSVFAHHAGHSTFSKIMSHDEFMSLMDINKEKYQALLPGREKSL